MALGIGLRVAQFVFEIKKSANSYACGHEKGVARALFYDLAQRSLSMKGVAHVARVKFGARGE